MKTVESGEFQWPVQSHTASYWKGQGPNSSYGLFSLTPPPWAELPAAHAAHIPSLEAPLIPGATQGKERAGQAALWSKHPDIKSFLRNALESLPTCNRQPLRHIKIAGLFWNLKEEEEEEKRGKVGGG